MVTALGGGILVGQPGRESDSATMSWFPLAVLALVVAVCESSTSGHHAKKCDCSYVIPRGYGQSAAAQGAQRLLQIRVDSEEQRITKAATQVHDLQAKADKILSKREYYAKKIRRIRSKIEHLEGSDCHDKDHFACHDGSGRCVSNLLVCDKVQDCNNGKDEEHELCELPKVGAQMVAHPKAEDSECLGEGRIITKFVLTIKKITPNEYLPGRPHLEVGVLATSSFHGKHIEEYFLQKGSWNPGRQRFILDPPPAYSPGGIACDFDGTDHNHCEGTFYNIHTHETCGHFTFTKTH